MTESSNPPAVRDDKGRITDPEYAAELGRKGAAAAQVARQAKAEQAEATTADLLAVAEILGGAREGVGPTAFAGALALADRLRSGKVEDRHSHYVAQAVAKLVEVGRLEAGDPTSTSLNVTANASDFQEWVHRLRDELSVSDNSQSPASSRPAVIDVPARPE